MTDITRPQHDRMKTALLAIQKLKARIDKLEHERNEPIAVIGLSCRFPGAADAESFWRLLHDGVDAIREVPPDRWDLENCYDADPAVPGKMYTRYGGFLDQIEQFDAHFFGIAPREAASLDPQHRLLLEVTWEALEHAGLPAGKLLGSRTGVFVGISTGDYAALLGRTGIAAIDAYVGSGTAHSTAVGRISYVLGLQGPCVALDTACSSSLVALHQACQGLRAGECDLALSGGVNAMLTPELTVYFSKARMLSPDGRCKTFDAAADGYVRGEGCGMLVLKRLTDARRDGDRVLAVILGSAVNQDGRSGGLTVPNGRAQERVIRDALMQGAVDPLSVGYLEAHGTGTPLGDPIEVQAAAAVLAKDRDREQPLLIGSVKTNIGHLEAAAGVAGVIKVILALQHGEIPAHLHFRQPNAYIPWDKLPVKVVRQRTIWSPVQGRRIAGVSAFAFSGTNAHVVIEEAPLAPPVSIVTNGLATPSTPLPDRPAHVLALSARSEPALRELARRYALWLEEHPGTDLADFCFTANTGRTHFEHRAALVTESVAQTHERLVALANGAPASVWEGVARGRPKVAFLLTGQGSQYAGMGRELYATQPTFREVIDRCAELLRPHLQKPLLDVLWENDAVLEQTAYTQPALFALEVALAELWRSWGVLPDVLLGHGAGEFAAACLAGVFTMEDGLRLIAERARLMQDLPPIGAMATVLAESVLLERKLTEWPEVSIASFNGPNTVVSGPMASLEPFLAVLAAEGTQAQRLATAHAFHSALVEPMLDRFEIYARTVPHRPVERTLISNLSGMALEANQTLDANYWRRHARLPVQFARSVQTLAELGCTVLVEIGPASMLLGMAERCWPANKVGPALVPSLGRDRSDSLQMCEAVACVFSQGITPDFAGFDRPWPRRKLSLPGYPFQRQRYWVESAATPSATCERPGEHPLLGRRQRSAAAGAVVYSSYLSTATQPFLADHRVFDVVVVPWALPTAMALATKGAPCRLCDVVFTEALVLTKKLGREVQLVLSSGLDNGVQTFQFFSAVDDKADGQWAVHASGTVQSLEPSSLTPERESLDELRATLQERAVTEVLAGFRTTGLGDGPAFHGIQTLWAGNGQAVGALTVLPWLAESVGDVPAHPTLLDSCFQVFLAAAATRLTTPGDLYVPLRIGAFELFAPLPRVVYCHVRLHDNTQPGIETWTADLSLLDEDGLRIGLIREFVIKRASHATVLRRTLSGVGEWFYEVEWRNQPRAGANLPADFFAEPTAIADQVRRVTANLVSAADAEQFAVLAEQLEVLSRLYIVQALARLKWRPQVGDMLDAARLAQDLGIQSRHNRLVHRFLEMLERDGLVARQGDGWTVRQLPGPADPTALQAKLLKRNPAGRIELTLLGRCGERLAEVLRGEADPLALLFPRDGADSAENLYRDSPAATFMNELIRQVVTAALGSLPPGRTLRVLEIGAGTGGTTDHVLPLVPADRTEFVYTDVTAAFFNAAEERFSAYPFVSYRVLDVEKDPQAQGFSAHQFDLVLAANVLHTTSNLPRSVHHAQQLLAPGGLLLLLEGTEKQGWLDLTFGLLPGWWKFDDAVRRDYPLLSVEDWSALLESAGFTQPNLLTPGGRRTGQGVIVARSPVGSSEATVETAGRWLIFCASGGRGADLATMLARRNQHCVRIERGQAYERLSADSFRVPAEDLGAFERLLDEAVPADTPLRGVVHEWSLDAAEIDATSSARLESDTRGSCASTLHLVQALVRRKLRPSTGLWLVTRGAQAAQANATVAVAQSPLWGLGKVIALEHPEFACRRLDLDPDGGADELEHLLGELLGPDAEDQVALRAGTRRVPRLVRSKLDQPREALALSANSTYLITGGLGALGLAVGRWLMERGARHLVLMGRRLTVTSSPTVDELRAGGADVRVVQGDVAREADVSSALLMIATSMPPLRGIVHAAGVTDDGLLLSQRWERFARVLAPKVLGAWNLHEQTKTLSLDFFVLFSSAASFLGSPGLGNYVAANSFLDGLAWARTAKWLPASSINWGPWAQLGMALTSEGARRRQSTGMSELRADQALAALERIISQRKTQVGVMAIDWAMMARQIGERPAPCILASLLQSVARPAHKPAPRPSDLRRRLDKAKPVERERLLRAYLREEVARVLRLGPERMPDSYQGFTDMGMDSLMAVQLRDHLQSGLGLEQPLTPTTLFDYPNIEGLARYLAEHLPMTEKPQRSETSARDWFYEVAWPERQRTDEHSSEGVRLQTLGSPEGMWLLFSDASDLAACLSTRLAQRNQRCLRIEPGDAYVQLSKDHYRIPAVDESALERLLAEVLPGDQPLQGIVHMWGLNAADGEALTLARLESESSRNCASVLHLVQALVRRQLHVSSGLWLLTRGAQSTQEGMTVSVAQSTLWGLGKVIALEHPELSCRRLDLDPASDLDEIEFLLAELQNPDVEDQIALRAGKRRVCRLVRCVLDRVPEPLALHHDATYLITGGLGGIGLAVGRWMTQRGARHLVLMGRRASATAQTTLDELRAAGTDIRVISGDVARAEDVQCLLLTIATSMPALRGIVHAAGVSDNGTILQQTWERFARVLAPKVLGSWNLHEQTKQIPLDFFVLFSSVASLLGAPGLSNYVAANTFMDGLAFFRKAQGLPAASVNWGPWAGLGMALIDEGEKGRRSLGISEMPADQALAALEQIITNRKTQVGVLAMDWAVLARQVADRPAPPMLASLLPMVTPALHPAPSPCSDFRRRLDRAEPGQRRQILQAYLLVEVARVLRLDPERKLDPRQAFTEMGMDSLKALELRDRLQNDLALERTLTPTAPFNYPTIEELAQYLAGLLPAPQGTRHVGTSERAQRNLTDAEPIAIVGLSCRFPMADNAQDYWRLLINGIDPVCEVPADRWDIDAYYDPNPDAPGKMYSRSGAFLEQVDRFDAAFFGIAPREAENLDPQQRLLLEVSWEAFEHAGMPVDRLRGSQTGVFVGIAGSDYAQLVCKGGDKAVDAYLATGTSPGAAAGRLSYLFGLQGPCVALDTACSSSLVALHFARRSLQAGECDLALAGGVNVNLAPERVIAECRGRMLSVDGRCKTFDAAADGFGRGEGCGVVVLKRFADARRDGDHIVAVIKGSAVNQNGRSGGLTVPNGLAQQRVVREALDSSGIQPNDIQYVEAHGTGTVLGDTIEVQALAAALGDGRGSDRPLLIGAVKTNIGHLEAAAGIAGLIKVALALQQQEIPPTLHFQKPNPYILWDQLPVKVVQERTPWPAGAGIRRAGVSSFGFSGTNAHVVLEEAPAALLQQDEASRTVRPLERALHLLAFSARSPAALRELAARHARSLEVHADADLANVCYTANTSRSHFEYRAALVIASRQQACGQLTAWAQGGGAADVRHGEARGQPKVALLFLAKGGLSAGTTRELLATQPIFRAVLERCSQFLKERWSQPLLQMLTDEEAPQELGYTEPIWYALQVAIAELGRSWGIAPDVVLGLGVGECAAACLAGLFSVEEGLSLVLERSRLAQSRLARPTALAVEESLAAFAAAITALPQRPAERTLVCSLSGAVVEPGQTLPADYWVAQAQQFTPAASCAETLAVSGCAVQVQVGSDPEWVALLKQTWPTDATVPATVPLVRSGPLIAALADLYVHGVTPDFVAFDKPWPRRKVALSTYPFQRQRYWLGDLPDQPVADKPSD